MKMTMMQVAVYRANNGWMVTREDGAWHQVVDQQHSSPEQPDELSLAAIVNSVLQTPDSEQGTL